MKIYIICPVRNGVEPFAIEYYETLVKEGHDVHFPPDHAPQEDPIGNLICETHLNAMRESDEVHVVWDVNSKGSHFDLGMAYALGKRILPVLRLSDEGPEKSYWKVMLHWSKA